MGVDLSDLMGGDGVPSDEQMRGTDDNNAESDAGAVDHPGGDTKLQADPSGVDDDTSGADEFDLDDGGQKPGKQKVPLEALHKERQRRQELQQKLQERDIEQARINDRLTRLLEAQQLANNPPPEAEVIPDFDEDPRGHVDGLRRQFEQRLAQLQQVASGQQQNTQQQQYFQQVQHQVAADEQVYRATAPDYNEAAQYFNDRKLAEYAALGLDPAQARQQLARDVFGVAQMAYQQGKNPAAVLHGLAKAFGFTGKAKPAPGNGGDDYDLSGYFPDGNGGGNGGGNSGAPARKAPNTSLSDLSGAARAPDEKGKLTAAQIGTMPDEDFDKLWAQMARQSNSSNRIKY